MTETKVTSKYQTTIPDDIRKCLKIDPGSKVEWYMVKGFAIVDKSQKIKNPEKMRFSEIILISRFYKYSLCYSQKISDIEMMKNRQSCMYFTMH